ncbi:unnamed protein product [Lupinus luteus]|uniref:Calmodulin-binding protein n=1 Tax=Lupinus luteus TaxID=3873 RepID=A0AAV1WGQ9_LUPLU
MVSNKKFLKEHESSDEIPIQKSKGKHVDAKQSMSDIRNVINVLCMNEHNSYVETFLRRVVRDVIEHKIQDYQFPRTRIHNQSGAKLFHLCFINKLPDKIFTLCNIIAEDKSPLQIALFDYSTKSIVHDGPFSSIKIEICALNGDFGSNGSDEDWTEEEFNANISKEREGKGPLVNGDRFITLKNGVGFITKMTFTDNSRWLRNRKFRLGAKVVQSASTGTNVKEAYKKHYPPALNDEVWRLAKIGKNGKIHTRLALHGIHTVKDLLQLYTINQSSLHEKFGKISKKLKLAIIEHAKTCVIDDYKLYNFHTEEQPIGLIFNSIYNLMEVTFDGQNYHSPNTLSPSEKNLVELVKQIAYKNVNSLKSIDETSLNRAATCIRACQSYAQDQVLQHINISTAYDIYQQETWSDNSEPFITTSYIDEGVHDYQTYVDPLPDQRDMSQNSYAEDEFFSGMYIEGDNWNLHGSSSAVYISNTQSSVA